MSDKITITRQTAQQLIDVGVVDESELEGWEPEPETPDPTLNDTDDDKNDVDFAKVDENSPLDLQILKAQSEGNWVLARQLKARLITASPTPISAAPAPVLARDNNLLAQAEAAAASGDYATSRRLKAAWYEGKPATTSAPAPKALSSEEQAAQLMAAITQAEQSRDTMRSIALKTQLMKLMGGIS